MYLFIFLYVICFPDDKISHKPKHAANNKADINSVLIADLYFLFTGLDIQTFAGLRKNKMLSQLASEHRIESQTPEYSLKFRGITRESDRKYVYME